MITNIRLKTRWLYHPVTVFLLLQALWVLVMVVWIRWYIEKNAQLREMAERLRTQMEVEGMGWGPMLEGALLLTLILAGATVIFIFWIKQRRLNEMQRAFVSNVTHELKSPVASIQLALETLALREMPEEKKREYIAMMLGDAERLTTLIDRILGAARIGKRPGRYRMEPVSIRRFIEDLLAEDRHLYEKEGRRIEFDKGRDVHAVIDRSAMRVVLGNLLENAARYSPPDARIRIRAPGNAQLPYRRRRPGERDPGQGSQKRGEDVRARRGGGDAAPARDRARPLHRAQYRQEPRRRGLGLEPRHRPRGHLQRASPAGPEILEPDGAAPPRTGSGGRGLT